MIPKITEIIQEDREQGISPNVLLVAYQCAIKQESVSQIGWNWYTGLAQHTPITLITHIRNKKFLQTRLPKDSDVIYIDTEWFSGWLYRLAKRYFPYSEHARFLLVSLDIYLFDWLAIRAVKQRIKRGFDWDITHVVTPVSPKYSTCLYKLKKPLLLGPWNGNVAYPKHFPKIVRRDSGWLYWFRQLAYLPQVLWRTIPNAHTIFVATQATLESIPKRYQSRCIQMLENGVDLSIFKSSPYPPAPSTKQPLEVVFVGRLIPVKAVDLLLTALARLQFAWQLHIVGEGAIRHDWEQTAEQLNISDMVHWHGALPLEQVAERIQKAHVLCLPSIRESGGGVLLEAMACARPVIAVDFGGPSELVDEQIGMLLPASGPTDLVDALESCFHDIVNHPEQWQQRGLVGRQRVEQHTDWDKKVAMMLQFYQKVLEEDGNS